jgi:hypothetical protein
MVLYAGRSAAEGEDAQTEGTAQPPQSGKAVPGCGTSQQPGEQDPQP